MLNTYKKWQRTPVIVTLATTPLSINEIPFPAITVCPLNQIRQTLYNYTENYKKYKANELNESDLLKFEQISLICNRDEYQGNISSFNLDIFDLFNKTTLTFEESIPYCEWNTLDCWQAFTPVILEEGVCFTFNMLPKEDIFKMGVFQYYNEPLNVTKYNNWNLEAGYSEDLSSMGKIPVRAPIPGLKAGLKLVLKELDTDLDYSCGDPMQGFKVVTLFRFFFWVILHVELF